MHCFALSISHFDLTRNAREHVLKIPGSRRVMPAFMPAENCNDRMLNAYFVKAQIGTRCAPLVARYRYLVTFILHTCAFRFRLKYTRESDKKLISGKDRSEISSTFKSLFRRRKNRIHLNGWTDEERMVNDTEQITDVFLDDVKFGEVKNASRHLSQLNLTVRAARDVKRN